MKLNKCEKLEANQYELEIAIEADVVKGAVSKVYKREAKRYNVPGFRKGHAPRNLIEKMYGEDVFHYDAVNEIFPEAYELALKEAKLDPVSRPDAEMVSLSTTDGAVLKVKVTVKPEMKIGKYKGLKATRPVETVEEARVDEEINQMLERNSRLLTREGKAENGDVANINYDGSIDGVPFSGGKAEGHSLNLGSGQFIEGFEEQVVGHVTGDEFDVNVTFPEKYHAEDLAGKAAVFKVNVNEIQYKELPVLDDEFAKDVSEYDTLVDLKNNIRDNMQKSLDEQADMEAENRLIEQIVETMEGEIPKIMYENRIDEMVQDFGYRLKQQGMNIETYLQYAGMDTAGFRAGFKEQAEKQVKMRLVLETIVKQEKIEATEEDISKEVERIAERYDMEIEKVKSLMPIDDIAKDLAVNKAIDYIKDNATITDEKADKASDKKSAAKKTAPKKNTAEKKAAKKADK